MGDFVYHGTEIKCGNEILAKGFLIPSKGDKHWLGDGYYFYKEEEYAFRWILLQYASGFKDDYKEYYNDIFIKYTIISADIDTDKIFDLDNIKDKLLFIKIGNIIKKKAEYSSRFKRKKIEDGVIINVMFSELGYDKDYDAVSATFPIAYSYNTDSRQDFLPEPQICVKNQIVIKNIQKHNKDIVPEHYKQFIDDYQSIKQEKVSTTGLYTNKTGNNKIYKFRKK